MSLILRYHQLNLLILIFEGYYKYFNFKIYLI